MIPAIFYFLLGIFATFGGILIFAGLIHDHYANDDGQIIL